jgi:mono/diheme cytochrome c family protein
MRRAFGLPAATAALALLTLGSCATGDRAPLAGLEAPPTPRAFDAALVKRGEALAAIGNCRTCHTAAGGRAFAGGLPLETPFGTIYSTNITPDPQTGIGRWSEEAFRRAMREGVDRGGHHLYPAFPYDRFTLVTDEDDRAIYAYLMTRPPVESRPPANRIRFPFNVRAFIGAWKALYFKPGPYRADPAHDAAWNRGAYLAEGLGHCSSCHTPRNALGAERADRHFDGGEAEGWHAYAINARSNAPVPWTVDALRAYLQRGWHPQHGVSRGPMAPVTHELAMANDADVRDMARYVVALMDGRRGPAAERAAQAPGDGSAGARLYESACVQCHDGERPLPFGGIPLARSIGVAGESPRNLANVILYGLPAADAATAPIMPGYAGAMTDAQVVELSRWMRARLTDKPPWEDLERVVAEARRAGPEGAQSVAGGAGLDPARMGDSR